MKNLYRTFSLLSILLISLFFKEDIQSEYTIPSYASSVYAVDFDNDGFKDIIVGHHNGWGSTFPAITIMKNIFWGNFEIIDTSKVFAGAQNNIFAVDVNNDGWPDIVSLYLFYNGVIHNYIRIYYNDNGTFPNNNYADFNLNTSATIDGVTYGDINGDGYIDLVVWSTNWGIWGVLYNDDTGSFSSPVYHSQSTPNDIVCADLNGDGRDDIIVCGQKTYVYFSYPSGFQSLLLDPNYMQQAGVVDFDLDGKKDIITYVYEWQNNCSILRMFKNLGNNTFQQIPDIIFPGAYGGLLVNDHTDFNNDGYPDLLFSTGGGDIIWYNQGNFQIADSQFVVVPYYGTDFTKGIYCADLDNNGYNDIITVQAPQSQNHSFLDIMFNDGQGHFIPDPIVGMQYHSNFTLSKLQNWPNPFQDETNFQFYLNESSLVELFVLDLQGKFVICIINQKLKGGSHTIKWRGLDNGNQPCKPGAFIAYLKVNGKICQSIKIIKA